MYSRKFGPRLRGKSAEIFGTHGLPSFAPQSRDYGGQAANVTERVICRTRIRSGFYENERSFRLAAESCTLAACAPPDADITSAREKRRFFRRADRRGANPMPDQGGGRRKMRQRGFSREF